MGFRVKGRLRRGVILFRLAARMRLVCLRRAYANLWLAGCTPEEEDKVGSFSEKEAEHLKYALQKRVESDVEPRDISVLCLGCGADPQNTPAPIRKWIERSNASGVWLSHLRMAMIRLSDAPGPRRLIIHELAHALLDVLSAGFRYPLAIEEGVARTAEAMLPNSSGVSAFATCHLAADSRHQEFLNVGERMTISDLLRFGQATSEPWDICAYRRMVTAAWWYEVFLGQCARKYSRLRRMLPEIRQRGYSSPDCIYMWLQEVTDWDAETLEGNFEVFCTTGLLPREVPVA